MQRNKHNEQHSSNHEKIKKLRQMTGKTPKWGNPMRERDSISFRKDLSLTTIHFLAKKDNLQHKIVPPQNCLEIVPQSVQLYGFAENITSKFVCTTCCCTFFMYDRPPSENYSKTASKNVPSFSSIFVPKFAIVRPVRIRTVQPIPTNNPTTPKTKNASLGFVP
jgi:hypothetical protein